MHTANQESGNQHTKYLDCIAETTLAMTYLLNTRMWPRQKLIPVLTHTVFEASVDVPTADSISSSPTGAVPAWQISRVINERNVL